MKKLISKKYFIKLITLTLALSCLFSVILIANVSASGLASISLEINQTFRASGDATQQNREMIYEFRPLNTAYPMPVGTINGVYAFVAVGNDRVQISPITFSSPGIFRYEITVVTQNIVGLRTDGRVYTVEISVVSDGRYAYNIFVDGEKTNEISFEHSIDVVRLNGSKTWNHGVLPQRYHPEYIVVLIMDGSDVVLRERVTQANSWRWSFVLPRYDGEREIVYTISEEPVVGYTMQTDGFNLINTFNRNDPNIPPDWNVPQTGDNANIILWISLVAVATVGLTFAVALTIFKKKRETAGKV